MCRQLVDVDTGEDVPAAVKHAVGEVRVRSKTVMLGYLGNPAETARAFDEHGFYKTGDLVYEDADGHYFFVERSVEMLTYKGTKVSPSEVEAVLLQHPGVREACVLGRRVGEGVSCDDLPAAFVSRADGAAGEDVTEGALRAAVAERLSDAHRLRGGVYFLDSLPRAGMSRKVARSKLKEMLRNLD
ncbi:hypothetical protein FOCC_FOCC000536 [Frankliniella occidentalis]|nr:hypothetical protein FOCC_FOCC000536 [Frankliniella occidentalis]